MSPLTKVFVFLVTILSILLVSLVVPFVASVDDLKAEREQAVTQFNAREAQIRRLNATNTTAESRVNEVTASMNATIGNLNQQVLALNSENRSLATELAQAKQSSTGSQATVESLTETNRILTAQVGQLSTALEDAKSQSVTGSARINEIVARNNELESLNRSLNTAVRRLKESLAAVQGGGSVAGIAGAGVSAAALGNGQALRGRITGVDAGGAAAGTLVQINIGDVDGVSANQPFVVHRDGNLVGRLRIQTVDERVAVAVVESSNGPIQAGDQVMLLNI